MGRRILWLVILQILLILTEGYAADKWRVEERLWQADIGAGGQYLSPAWSGHVDLQRDLGFQKSLLPELRITYNGNDKNGVRVDLFGGNFVGAFQRTVRQPFLGGLISREVHHQVSEDLHMNYWKVGWIHYGNSHSKDKVRVGFLLDIKSVALRGKAKVTSVMEGSSPVTLYNQADWSMTSPVPGLVVEGRPNDRFSYFIECSGLTNGKNGFLFLDYEASVKWLLDDKKKTNWVVGYHVIRYENYHTTAKSRLDNVQLSGWFYGLTTQF